MTPPLFLASPEALAEGTGRIRLTGSEGHHAVRVRRIAPGETVDVTDGLGSRASCTVSAVAGDTAELEVVRLVTEEPPRPRIVVVQALPKGERGELAVELLTEVGADVIVPWAAARCVTQWRGPRAEKSLSRWRATAREAGKQARRSRMPEVSGLATTAEVCRRLHAAASALVLHEAAAGSLPSVEVPADGDVVLVVGPEGGISEEERVAFAAAGSAEVRLGPSVMRTSTAGAAACAVVLARSGRWG